MARALPKSITPPNFGLAEPPIKAMSLRNSGSANCTAMEKSLPQTKRLPPNLYRMAAGQGYAEAQHRLGTSYHRGWGVAEDDKEAVRWYRKSAVQGYPGAQCLIATMPTSSEQGKPATLPHPLASAGFRTT